MSDTQHVIVHIHNAYEDGHESSRRVCVLAPASVPTIEALNEWFEGVVYPHTGDGHGIGGMGSCYTATIQAATGDLNRFVGTQHEWVD
jgi:hypothetical protein